MDILNKIEQYLIEKKLDCSLLEATQNNEIPRLLVFLGEEKKGEIVLELTSYEQLLSKQEDTPLAIHFQVNLPFEVQPFATSDTARLVSLVNCNIELPGFELDELEKRILYRYVLFTKKQDPCLDTIHAILGICRMLVDLFSEAFALVSSGEKTTNDILEEFLEKSNPLK